jgi:hypothetical protein
MPKYEQSSVVSEASMFACDDVWRAPLPPPSVIEGEDLRERVEASTGQLFALALHRRLEHQLMTAEDPEKA